MTTCLSGLALTDLPVELIVLILSFLDFQSLSRVELVSKRLRSISKLAWRTFKRLDLSRRATPSADIYQFSDPHWNRRFLESATSKCERLASLNLALDRVGAFRSIEHTWFAELSLGLLREIDLKWCSINDKQVTSLFKNCKCLESIDLSMCNLLTGVCLRDARETLLSAISVNYCCNLEETYLAEFVEENGPRLLNGFHASLFKRKTFLSPRFFSAVELNLARRTRRLSLTSSEQCDFSRFLFKFERLTELDLSNSNANDPMFALILNRCTQLTSLSLAVTRAGDEAFSSLPVNAPLRTLDVSGALLTDFALERMAFYLASTLRDLNAAICGRLTGEGVLQFLQRCTAIRFVNLWRSSGMDNQMLTRLVQENVYFSNPVSIYCLNCPNLMMNAFLNNKVERDDYNDEDSSLVLNNLKLFYNCEYNVYLSRR